MVCWKEKLSGFGGAKREVMLRNRDAGRRAREQVMGRVVSSSEVLSQEAEEEASMIEVTGHLASLTTEDRESKKEEKHQPPITINNISCEL